MVINKENKLYKLYVQLFKFFLAGLPSFIIAIPLNWFLVEIIENDKSTSYLITLFFQVTVNFIFLRQFVFTDKKDESFLSLYLKFLSGIAFFRFLDWVLYTLLVNYTEIYYLFIQIGNVIIFAFFKFFYSKFIMEKKQ